MVPRFGSDAPAPRRSFVRETSAVLLIIGVVLAAYHNSFPGAFLLDDVSNVLENRSIRTLSDLGAVLSPPADAGVGGRPVPNLTFAVNYAVGRLDAWSYHATNVAIHLAATLTLFGVVRRTMMRAVLPPPVRAASTEIAIATAILWGVHPLATAAVNYVSQRTELLMGFFYLLTLYGFIRSVETRSRVWAMFAVVCCALGMASKEVMISAPLALLLYDRTFFAGTWRDALRQRRAIYFGLAATWLLLAGLIATSRLSERGVGFELGVTWIDYALTQARAVLIYLRLALFPDPLVFDYGWTFERTFGGAAPALTGCAALVAATLFACRNHPALGFAGCLVILILAPTSTFIPIIHQPIAESRMYLPLGVVVTLLVTTMVRWLGRLAWLPLTGAMVALGLVTLQRHPVYQHEVSLWSDTVARQPANARAHGNLSAAWLRAGRAQDAIAAAKKAVELRPAYADAHHNLALALLRSGQVTGAIEQYEIALRANPAAVDTHYNLGAALLGAGRIDEATHHLEKATRLNPGHAKAHNNLSVVLLQRGRASEAAEHGRAALRLAPEFAEAHYNLGNALAQLGDRAAAIASYEAALRTDPSFAKAHNNLGVLRLQAGDSAAAVRHFEAALQLDPAYEPARRNRELAISKGK